MPEIPAGSVDMILCDLPYGKTQNDWDRIIPFVPLWEQYERAIKDNGVIVLTAQQPFTSQLVMSNLQLFKYSMVWDKRLGTGFLNANKMPLSIHEDILVFSKATNGNYTYNPQMRKGKMRKKATGHASSNYGRFERLDKINDIYHPTTIVDVYAKQEGKEHPTQKPVELFMYLIETYSNVGDTVLDNCMGSGTTAKAAISCSRNYIGIERELEYVNLAKAGLKCVQPVMSF
jgi:site-specific DNA-methyltransferase (adenine-specific)